jgi:hypothetical protein
MAAAAALRSLQFFFFTKLQGLKVTTENHPICADLLNQFGFFGQGRANQSDK